MNCKQVGEDLLDVASGSPAALELEEHLHSCAACATQLKELRATMALLDEWKAPEPSPYFDVRLQARLRELAEQAPRGWLEWLRKPALALTMAVLMIGGLLSFYGGREPVVSNGAQAVQPGTAVSDLQTLERNNDLLANFDLLDEINPQQQQQEVNP